MTGGPWSAAIPVVTSASDPSGAPTLRQPTANPLLIFHKELSLTEGTAECPYLPLTYTFFFQSVMHVALDRPLRDHDPRRNSPWHPASPRYPNRPTGEIEFGLRGDIWAMTGF